MTQVNVRQFLHRILTTNGIEGAAADAHNIGWKAVKDADLADISNPFVGWGKSRVRVNEELKALDREALNTRLGVEIGEEKYAAIQSAADGKDITHPLNIGSGLSLEVESP